MNKGRDGANKKFMVSILEPILYSKHASTSGYLNAKFHPAKYLDR